MAHTNRLGKFLSWSVFCTLSFHSYSQVLIEDPTFSNDGTMTLDFTGGASIDNNWVGKVQVLENGNIVIAGSVYIDPVSYFLVARLNPDGTFDTTFDSDGYRLDDILTGGSYLGDLVVQPDGKLVAAGSVQTINGLDMVAVRYNLDGSLDNTFALNGVTIWNPSGYDDWGTSIDLQSDGKVVVAGISYNANGDSDVSVARLNTDGSLDTTFNTTGIFVSDINGYDDIAAEIDVLTDGKILIGGSTVSGSVSEYDFLLMRLNANGTADNAFGTGGKVMTDLHSFDDEARSLTVQEDGKILLSGWTAVFSDDFWNPDFAIARYNSDGSLDNSFSYDGQFVSPINGVSTTNDFAFTTIIDSDGKILLGGGSSSSDNSSSTFVIMRLNNDGSVDNSFEGDGFYSTDAFSSASIYDFVFQPDGKLMVAGITSDHIALARYNLVNDLGAESNALKTLHVSAYPNPSNGIFYLSSDQANRMKDLKLYDATGRLIWCNANPADSGALNMDLTNLADGSYLLHVSTDTGTEVIKLLKQAH